MWCGPLQARTQGHSQERHYIASGGLEGNDLKSAGLSALGWLKRGWVAKRMFEIRPYFVRPECACMSEGANALADETMKPAGDRQQVPEALTEGRRGNDCRQIPGEYDENTIQIGSCSSWHQSIEPLGRHALRGAQQSEPDTALHHLGHRRHEHSGRS